MKKKLRFLSVVVALLLFFALVMTRGICISSEMEADESDTPVYSDEGGAEEEGGGAAEEGGGAAEEGDDSAEPDADAGSGDAEELEVE